MFALRDIKSQMFIYGQKGWWGQRNYRLYVEGKNHPSTKLPLHATKKRLWTREYDARKWARYPKIDSNGKYVRDENNRFLYDTLIGTHLELVEIKLVEV